MDFNNLNNMSMEELYEFVYEAIPQAVEKWMEDEADDQAARAILGSIIPLIDAVRDPQELSPLMLQVVANHMRSLIISVSAIEMLANTKENENG